MRTIKRKDWNKYKRLGKGNKSKLKWRKADGRHNKIRENIRGHQKKPNIGMKKEVKPTNTIRINTIKELAKVDKKMTVIINKRIGMKKKMMIIEEAKKQGIKIKNENSKKTKTVGGKK